MKKVPLLKEVDKKIFELFKELKIEPIQKENILKKINQGLRRFYTPVCKDEEGKKILLKIRVLKSRLVSKQLKGEVKVLHFLKRISKKFNLNFLFPSILKVGRFQNLNFCLKNFEEGKLAGQVLRDFGYKKFFLKDVSPDKMAKAISSLQKIPDTYFKNLKLYKRGGLSYLKNFIYYKKTFFKFFLKSQFNQEIIKKNEIEKAEEILKKNKKFLDEMAKFPTHGDLYPNNILVTKDKKLFILDWESFHLDNQFFDPCFVWLWAHKNEKWQKKFFNLIIKNSPEGFEKLFPSVVISLTIRSIEPCWYVLKQMKKIYPLPEIFKSYEFNLLKYYLGVFKKAISYF
jgi:thiamine kinase-like enzyme